MTKDATTTAGIGYLERAVRAGRERRVIEQSRVRTRRKEMHAQFRDALAGRAAAGLDEPAVLLV